MVLQVLQSCLSSLRNWPTKHGWILYFILSYDGVKRADLQNTATYSLRERKEYLRKRHNKDMRYGANQLTYASLFTIHDSKMQITLATAQWSLTFNATQQQACPSRSVAPLQSGHVVRVRHHYATPPISRQPINPPSCCECRKRKPALELDNTPRSITSKITRKNKLTISKHFYVLRVTQCGPRVAN
jgi:hypothetical protein